MILQREPDVSPVGRPMRTRERPFSLWREDAIAAASGGVLMLGLLLDGWNHINLQNGALGGFFTPWHGLLYAGFTLSASWVITRNAHLYRPDRVAKPQFHPILGVPLRYPLAMVGIVIASAGVVGDALWHTLFGEETGVARVIAPFHLLLFTGAALVLSAPLRSGWHAPETYPPRPSLAQILPPLCSLTLITALVAFMFQWLSAFTDWAPSLQLGHLPAGLADDPRVRGTVELAGVARVVVTNLILVAPVLLALRRWRLPFGSVTVMWTAVAVFMSALTNFRSGGAVLAAGAGGLFTDLLIARLNPSPAHPLTLRLLGALTPGVTWSTFFLLTALIHDTPWPGDLWMGTVGVASMTGIALSFLAVPVAVPETVLEAGGSDPEFPSPPMPCQVPIH
ncbi:MAG TPA: hypothetical protein VG034_21765 [Acidimicrobiia bacterium]|jgi:hypothetical protein|nr:hypothetical protein [Acidimicrobiia bacterium]